MEPTFTIYSNNNRIEMLEIFIQKRGMVLFTNVYCGKTEHTTV